MKENNKGIIVNFWLDYLSEFWITYRDIINNRFLFNEIVGIKDARIEVNRGILGKQLICLWCAVNQAVTCFTRHTYTCHRSSNSTWSYTETHGQIWTASMLTTSADVRFARILKINNSNIKIVIARTNFTWIIPYNYSSICVIYIISEQFYTDKYKILTDN